MKEFYRVSEVMEILNTGRTKTYQMIRAGTIPSANIDGNIRVPVRLLHEKIEAIILTSNRDEVAPTPGADDAASGRGIGPKTSTHTAGASERQRISEPTMPKQPPQARRRIKAGE